MRLKSKEKSYVDRQFGFPILVKRAPLIKVNGRWIIDINCFDYEHSVLSALTSKTSRLSGNEIKFIRRSFGMSLVEFGRRFGNVAHSAVIKWEKFGNAPSNMNWATEKDIRLALRKKLNPRSLIKLYDELADVPDMRAMTLEINAFEYLSLTKG